MDRKYFLGSSTPTETVKQLRVVKNALVENGLVPLTTPNEMLPDAIEKGLVEFEKQILEKNKDYGAIYNNKYRVRYFDADGTILKIEYVAEGGKLTPPAKTPNYDPDYLIFDEWNYDIENYVVEQPTDIGAIYKTVDDATYLFCRFTYNTTLTPTLNISGFTSIDWGDGTINTNNSHTYAEEGDYLIKIKGDLSFNTASSKYLLGSNVLNCALIKCFLKKGITTINEYAFQLCFGVINITLPQGITNIGTGGFRYCTSLKYITLPQGITNIKNYVFQYCTSLKYITLPQGITTISYGMFEKCGIESISIPQGTARIDSNAFYEIERLREISISQGITTIETNAITMARDLRNYYILCKSVPTLMSSNSISNTLKSTIIWVNNDIIEDLKVAKNWSTYASYMKPLSWYPSLTDPNAE